MDFRKKTGTEDDGRTVTMGHRRRTGSAPWWRLPLILAVLLGLLVLLVTQLRGDRLSGRAIQEHVGEPPSGGSEGAPVQRSPLGGIVPGGEGPGPLTVPPPGTQSPAGRGGIPAPNGQGLQLPPIDASPGARPTQPDGAAPVPVEPAEPGVDSPGPAVPPPAAPPGTGQP